MHSTPLSMHAFNISEQAVPVWAAFRSNVIFNIRTRSQHMKHAERVFIYFIRLPAFNPDVLLHSEQAASRCRTDHVQELVPIAGRKTDFNALNEIDYFVVKLLLLRRDICSIKLQRVAVGI